MISELHLLVVGDDALARGGLAALLGNSGDVHVDALLSSRDDVPARAASIEGGAVVWDLGHDARAGIERVRDAGALPVPLAVLLPDEAHAREAYDAGARGLVLRDGDPERLGPLLRAVAAGSVVLDPEVAASLLRGAPVRPVTTELLTPRELEVLELLARGMSNRQIAEALGFSDHTAKFHVNAILTKLGAETRTEAVVLAAKLGLVVL
ncbi:response regulator transcription factor [Myxococcota bacterium]|nr:response regulator transcription factor [Myxococcota bacterium]